MKTLYIDTHMFDIHMLLFNDTELIKEEHVYGEKYNSTFLIPTLEKVLENNTFDQIIVINGPGSFTGVRLGITIAKTLAYTMNKEIKVISYFDAMDYSLDDDSYTFAISDGNGYYVASYECGKIVDKPVYLNNKDYLEYSDDKKIETDVVIDYKKILNKVKDITPVNPHSVKPIYIKLIGVEYDKKN